MIHDYSEVEMVKFTVSQHGDNERKREIEKEKGRATQRETQTERETGEKNYKSKQNKRNEWRNPLTHTQKHTHIKKWNQNKIGAHTESGKKNSRFCCVGLFVFNFHFCFPFFFC